MGSGAVLTGDSLTTLYEQHAGSLFGYCARRVGPNVLGALPARQRDVLLLFAIGELEYAEIAQAMNIPLGSVQSALHRARIKLRAALTEGEA